MSFIFGASGHLLSTSYAPGSMYFTLENATASLPSSCLSQVEEVFDSKVMGKEGGREYKAPRSSRRNSEEEGVLEDGRTSMNGGKGILKGTGRGSPSCL